MSSVCTSRAASPVLSLSPQERSSLLHALSLSLLDVQWSSLRAEELTDYRLSGRNRPALSQRRTLHLSCVEAFGRPPAALLFELRLNAAHRALIRPADHTTVTHVAARYGFAHFVRFAGVYRRQFGELPPVTFANARRG